MKRNLQFGCLTLAGVLLLFTAHFLWCQAPAVSVPQQRHSLATDVGRSIVLSTDQRLRRVYISNPAVLDSITANPRELILTAKAPGASSLALWKEDGSVTLYDFVANLDVVAAQSALRSAFPDEKIDVSSQEGRLLLTGVASSPAVIEAAVKMLGTYSKEVVDSARVEPVHPPQVQLKVRIAEVDRTKLNQFGINILSGGITKAVTATQQFGTVNLRDDGALGLTDLLNIFIYNKNIDLGMILKDLQQNQVLQVLAEPNLTAISGQSAHFLAGGEFPFPVIQGSSGGLTSITIQFRPFGVKLDFTPIVNRDGTVRLKVAPEVSALDYTNAVTMSGYTIPAISTRRAETEIELRDGQSFAMSGLLDHRTTERLSKMPGIGDIPILGELFKSREINKSFTDLIVIITPVIVDPVAAPVVTPLLPKESVPDLNVHQFDEALKSQEKQPKEQIGPSETAH